jgi:hypothetical protein
MHILNTLFEHPVLAVIAVALIVSLVITIIKKLLKLAVSISIVIIALAIVLHCFGEDTLPREGKEALRHIEELLD